MDCAKVGALIRFLRTEKGLTQRALAEKLMVSDKAVSKWERALGCPDVTVLGKLSQVLEVNVQQVLQGEITVSNFVSGNMQKTRFFVCPTCGNVTLCTGDALIFCCGRPLKALTPAKADDTRKLQVELSDGEWFITSRHPMTKENYISFVAFVSGGRLEIIKQYPEWELQLRLPCREHGRLVWYAPDDGLLYQLV